MSETHEEWADFDWQAFGISDNGNSSNDNGYSERMPILLLSPTAMASKPTTASNPVIAAPVHQIPPIVFPPIWYWGFAGVEATQSTQFFLINGAGSGAGVNNSVPLIEKKEMILRVYPRQGFVGTAPTQVTGVVSRSGKPDLAPLNGPVAVQAVNGIQRSNINHSLNFRIPAADCVGTVTFTIKLVDSANALNFKRQTVTLTFQAVPELRVHGVLIHYTGNGLNIAAPSGTDLVNTLAWIGRTYPISGITYTACEVVEFNGDLTVGGGGGCGTGWNQLFNTLWNMRNASSPDASGNRDVFVGLLPSGVPTSGVIGCGGSGVAIAYTGGGSVLAQEVGHGFSRAHAPCGNPGGPDPNYPVYGSYPSASIGEFGLDTSNLTVFNPASTYDFMSYCGPVWVSPYTYVALKNAVVTGLGGAPAHPDRAGSRNVAGDYLFLNFRVHKRGKVELLNSFHLYTDHPPTETGERTDIGCDLLGEDGNVIESHHCQMTNPHMDQESSYQDFHEAIRWNDKCASIAFTRSGQIFDTLDVSNSAPVASFTGTKQVERATKAVAAVADGSAVANGAGTPTALSTNLLRLEWNIKQPVAAGAARASARGAKAPKEPVTETPTHALLRYSNDGGTNWRVVATDLTNDSHVVNLNQLPGGDQCLFQLVAASGVRTSLTTTKPVAVPIKPRKAYILSPDKSQSTYAKGQDVVLLGGGFSPDFESSNFDDVVWTSDRDGLVGAGYQVITNSLSSGRHRIQISLPDGLEGEALASVFITIK